MITNLYTSQDLEKSLLEKFLRYVKINTQSHEEADSYPSTECQWDLLRLLEQELKSFGLKDVVLDQYGYLIATIPSNVNHAVPTVGFIAHVDTSPEVSGANVKPQVISNYQGGDITLPGDNSVVICTSDFPALKNNIGNTIVTSDGTTLLGADDKAGVAIIMTLAEFLQQHPEIPHGAIKFAFTPDEEVGAGTKYFDVKKFGAEFAYTIDGGSMGEINQETFSANTAVITVHGMNTHPGKAKNIMVNAARILSEIVARLPKEMAPETTSGYEPYIHPHQIEGGVSKAVVKILLRDFVTAGLDKLKAKLENIIAAVDALYPKAKIDLEIIESYRNMKDDLAKDSRVTDYLWEAAVRADAKPHWEPIRGGTDGSQLTAKGLLTPNIFTGSAGHHGKTEWASIYEMGKAFTIALNLAQIWTGEKPSE